MTIRLSPSPGCSRPRYQGRGLRVVAGSRSAVVAGQLQPVSGHWPPPPGLGMVDGWRGRCGWHGRPAGGRAVLAVAAAVMGALGAAGDRPRAAAGRLPWVSLPISTTTSAPKAAYSSARRTRAASSSSERARTGRSLRLSVTNAASSRRVPTAAAAGRGGRPRPCRCQAVRSARSETPSSLRVWLMPTSAALRHACSATVRSS